jgi:hypothetical protein
MAIDWMNPSDDILEARRVGQQDRQDEVDELQAALEDWRGQAVDCNHEIVRLRAANDHLRAESHAWEKTAMRLAAKAGPDGGYPNV